MKQPTFYPELDRANVTEHDQLPYGKILDYLSDDDLANDIVSGRATVAMLRPGLHEAMLDRGITDPEACDMIERDIRYLGIGLKFSVMFDEHSMDEFYDGPPKYESMLPKPPERNTEFGNRWEEFVDLMTSGPVTVLILKDTEGGAVPKWRQQLGHWNVEAKRDPETLRGRHARDNFNNLLHGSDSITSVVREIDIIYGLLRRKLSDNKVVSPE